MNSKYVLFGLAVILLLIMATVLACFFIKGNSNEVEEDLIVGETVEKNFNFIDELIPWPDPIVTSADIEAYNQAGQNISESDRLAFYTNLTTAHETLDFGGFLDGQISEENSRTVDPDLLVDLVMSDIYALSEASLEEQFFAAPIFTEDEIPEYAYAVTSAYPPLYLLEVMMRDKVLSAVIGSYEVPDRSTYFARGMAMGLYYESDIEKAEEFAEEYMLRATASDAFWQLTTDEELMNVGGPVDEVNLETLSPELREQYEEYKAAVEKAKQEFISNQTNQ